MKLLKRTTALCLALCVCFTLFGCMRTGDDPNTTKPSDNGGSTTHTVQVKTDSGTVLEGVGIYVYEDTSKQELLWFAKTDAEGKITFDAPVADGYAAFLENVPQGYEVAQQYLLTGTDTVITLNTQLLSGDLDGVNLKLGDVMYDLQITDINGNTYQISELLKLKKAVMLNFWFISCTPCKMEFPYMQQAYEDYKNDVEVLLLDPADTDVDAIKAFIEEMKLTMPAAVCDKDLEKALNILSCPTTIVIDRNGIISFVHSGTITSAQTFRDIFAYFTAEDYQAGVVTDLEQIPVSDPNAAEDEIKNPTEVGGLKSFQLTVKPGETVYCDVYRVFNAYMTINSKNAQLKIDNKTYKPDDGKISVLVSAKDTFTPLSIALTNTGTEIETFTINMNSKSGTVDNPKKMILGEFSVSIPAGEQEGIYYRYTAEKDGELVLQCLSATKGQDYDYTLYNLNPYANRNLAADAQLDADGNTVVAVKVKKGQKIQFSCSALPRDDGTYPAIKMTFLAKHTDGKGDEDEDAKKILYAVTVTDENRKPVPGVNVYIQTPDGVQNLTGNDKGLAYIKLLPAQYKATVKVPVGYAAQTTEFTLTQENPNVALKLDTIAFDTRTYTVAVVDEKGAALKDVLVTVGNSYALTDAEGKAVFDIEAGDYLAVIGLPDGYTADTIAYEFDANGNAKIVLTKTDSTQPPENAGAYQVEIKDADGKPVTTAVVTFYQDGNPVGAAQTNSSGIAQKLLTKGEYTIGLAFASGSYLYDTTSVLFTDESLSAQVTVVKKVTKYTEEYYFGLTYFLSEGTQYVENLQNNVVNFFSFTPDRSGWYEVTVDNGKIMLLGSNTIFVNSEADGKTFTQDTIELEVREDNLGDALQFIIGLYGTSDATVSIKRTGDIVLTEEEKAEWILWSGTQAPAAGTTFRPSESGTLTFIDLSGTTDANKPVKGNDGYYHLGSKTGPILYVSLGKSFRYQLDIRTMMGLNPPIGGTQFNAVFYEGETFIKKETYNECMKAYCEAVDINGDGVYPLNDDLIYMIQNVGRQKQWWDATSPNFVFDTVTNLNTEIAWMFNVCYYR